MAPLPTDLPATLRAALTAHGQAHLIAQWERLPEDGRAALLEALQVCVCVCVCVCVRVCV
jgi:hypothetical protein